MNTANGYDLKRLIAHLRAHEGVRAKPYTDTVGKLSIGVGRNLTDNGLSQEEIDYLLANDIAKAEQEARALVPSLDSLDPVRKEVLIEMAFNMGRPRLAGFKNMLSAVGRKDFARAAAEMLDSRWAVQVGNRAKVLANAMELGRF